MVIKDDFTILSAFKLFTQTSTISAKDLEKGLLSIEFSDFTQ